MLYREHKGTLADSMATVKEVRDFAHLLEVIRESRSHWPTLDGTVTPETVKVEPYGRDDRIGWDTHMVTVNGQAEGFTDGPVI